MKHLVDIDSLDKESINKIVTNKTEIIDNSLTGKIAALLFFEPSTRTLLSFQTAIYKLGMNPLVLNISNSSKKKGESELDTVKTIMQYADIIIIRHPDDNFVKKCCEISIVPIINAGSGSSSHPTQALVDLFTIMEYHKPPFKIGFAGDLKSSRTVKSLLKLLDKIYKNIIFYFVPDGNLTIEDDITNNLVNPFQCKTKITEIIDKVDILYMTRIQKERVNSKNAKLTLKLTEDLLNRSKDDMILMHPLPRLDEIPVEIDSSPKAIYFRTVKNSVKVRMSIIKWCID